MSDDLNTEIKIGANASGVEAGVSKAKKSLASLGAAAVEAARESAKGLGTVGKEGEKAAKQIENAAKSTVSSLQKQIAALESGGRSTRQYKEALAGLRGIDANALKPLLDRLDEAKTKTKAAAKATGQLTSNYAGLSGAALSAGRVLAAIGIGVSAREFIRMADASTNVASRLSLVTSSAAELASVQRQLFITAQSSRVSFVDLAQTYSQMSRATKELGVSQNDMLAITKTISQAVTISGGSAQSAQAALIQLSQGFAAGALRGEELNSIMEQTPRLAQAIANGLGVGIGKLREMGKAGELTAEAVLGALQKAASGIEAEFARMTPTVEQSITKITNSMLKLVGAVDSLFGATSKISGAFGVISQAMDFIGGDIAKINSQGALREAASQVLALDQRATQLRSGMANGFYGVNTAADLARVNRELEVAKIRFNELNAAARGGGNASDQSAYRSRGQSYEAEAARQSKLADDLNNVRMKLSGVPESYVKDMKEIIRLNQAGVLVGKEYNDALKKQQESLDKKGASSAASAINAEKNAYESLISSIRTKIESERMELAGGHALTESQKIRVKLDQELASGKLKLSAAHRAVATSALEELAVLERQQLVLSANKAYDAERAKIAEEISAAYVAEGKAREQGRQAVSDYAQAIEDQNEKTRFEISLSGKTTAAREIAIRQYQIELDLKKQIDAIDRNPGFDEIQRIEERTRARTAAAKASAGAESSVYLDEWKKTSDAIESSITDALLRGFESGKGFAKNLRDTLINMFKTMVLRPIISAVVNPVAQGVTGALGLAGGANAGQGGGLAGLGNLANTASNLYSAASSIATVGTQVLAGSMSLANAAGTIAANATGTGLTGLLATNGAYGTAAAGTASAAAGGAASALAAIPVVGWVALAAVAAYAIFGKKGGGPKTESGGGYGIGGYMNSGGPTLEYAKGIEAGYAGLAKQLGLNSALSVGAFTSQDPKGDSMTQVEVLAALNGQRIYGRGERLGGVENVGRSQEELKAVLAEETTRVMFAALRASELPEQYKAYLDTMTSSVESMNAAISQVVAVKQFADALAGLPFENLKELGFNASAGLLAAAGSMENMISALTTYYDLYYSEAERLAQSQKDMARILRSINIELPRTKDEFRGIVEALDLNTESGRAAYVTLLNLAPQFAASADLVSQFAQETAKKLISTFTVKGKLLPALDASSLKLDKLTGAIVQSGESAGYISRLFLDVSSGLIGFGSVTKTLTGGLTDAQKSALALSREIEALEDNADKARIDFAGLSAALAGFDTETFITTVSLAFEGLAERISRVIDSIGDERIAVREAALQIINPAVMSRDAILRSIAGVSVNAPGNAGLSAAQESLRQSDAAVAARQAALVQAKAQSPSTAALDSTRAALTAAQNAMAAAQSEVDRYRVIEGGKFNWWLDQAFAGNDLRGMVPDPSGERNAQNTVFNLQAAQRNEAPLRSPYEQALAAYGNEAAASAQKVAAAQSLLNSAVAEQTRAVDSARAAQLAYVASIQDFAIDASKAVTRLGKLREETVKYFEAQKQLADLMQNSANQLRKTVNDFRFGQLDPQQQFDDLQTRFAKAYAMALSTDGSVLAGYGDQLNGLINPLLDKAREIYASDGEFNTFAATTLARAENIAGRIDALTPKDYAADSLQMLASIDATLAALDASSKSAEKIIAEAVTAGSEKTAAGLRAVIAALTNQTIPGFAAGGTFSGGLRIVGENGPELEATGPSRILSSSQTMSLLSGGAYNMASELSALRQEVSNLRLEAQATAANTSRIARQGDRNEIDGLNIRNDIDAPIYTRAV